MLSEGIRDGGPLSINVWVDSAQGAHGLPNGTSNANGSRTPVGEDWELDCEICGRRGINQVRISC
jgi:hypothetical protein